MKKTFLKIYRKKVIITLCLATGVMSIRAAETVNPPWKWGQGISPSQELVVAFESQKPQRGVVKLPKDEEVHNFLRQQQESKGVNKESVRQDDNPNVRKY